MLTRALIVLLLVLNLGVAVWWATRAPVAPPAPVVPPAGVARLQLVSEALPAQRAPSQADAGPVVENQAVISQCLSLGPFSSDAMAAAAREQLQPLVLEIHPRREPIGEARGWEVLLPPLESIEQAEAAGQRIAAAGFEDFYVMRDGARAGAVALGVYSTEASARERVATLAAAGFEAKTETRVGGPTEYWLDVAADAGFDPDAAQALVEATRSEPMACSQFGTPDDQGRSEQVHPGLVRRRPRS